MISWVIGLETGHDRLTLIWICVALNSGRNITTFIEWQWTMYISFLVLTALGLPPPPGSMGGWSPKKWSQWLRSGSGKHDPAPRPLRSCSSIELLVPRKHHSFPFQISSRYPLCCICPHSRHALDRHKQIYNLVKVFSLPKGCLCPAFHVVLWQAPNSQQCNSAGRLGNMNCIEKYTREYRIIPTKSRYKIRDDNAL